MKKQFLFQLIFILLAAISWSQQPIKAKHIKAWGVKGEKASPRAGLMAGKDVYFVIVDERTLTSENWDAIFQCLSNSLFETYPNANITSIPEQEFSNYDLSSSLVVKVAVQDCQVYFSKAKWHAKTTFNASIQKGTTALNGQVFTNEVTKGNMLGNTSGMDAHIKAYNNVMEEFLTYLDDVFTQ